MRLYKASQAIRSVNFLKWGTVGLITFLLDYLIFIFLFNKGYSVFFSNICSGSISIFFNYLSHYLWSFKSNINHLKSGFRYILNLVFFWTLGTLLLKFLISIGIEAKYAKLLPVPVLSPLSYLSLRFLVFKNIQIN